MKTNIILAGLYSLFFFQFSQRSKHTPGLLKVLWALGPEPIVPNGEVGHTSS